MSGGVFSGFAGVCAAFEKRAFTALLQFFGKTQLYRSMFS